jgi:hypothetical protein
MTDTPEEIIAKLQAENTILKTKNAKLRNVLGDLWYYALESFTCLEIDFCICSSCYDAHDSKLAATQCCSLKKAKKRFRTYCPMCRKCYYEEYNEALLCCNGFSCYECSRKYMTKAEADKCCSKCIKCGTEHINSIEAKYCCELDSENNCPECNILMTWERQNGIDIDAYCSKCNKYYIWDYEINEYIVGSGIPQTHKN